MRGLTLCRQLCMLLLSLSFVFTMVSAHTRGRSSRQRRQYVNFDSASAVGLYR